MEKRRVRKSLIQRDNNWKYYKNKGRQYNPGKSEVWLKCQITLYTSFQIKLGNEVFPVSLIFFY